eukprot:TRINITY_DN13914_c0_g1_i1.p1 TRINITY_DN13914_c0_g1~~TRINITY_DN13914_c0_g1_i1.p1  ORF type:complete len:944 (-),score=372.42 TRINITY_DN13914_c0_g1_i1:155-2986(-)
MPCTIKVRIIEGRNLPVMDRSSDLTDAYVEIRWLESIKKTEICRKTLNPIWNEDFRVDVPSDSDLQDNPLRLKVWDHDVVSADDVIGSIYVDLNCLLNPNSRGQLSGWFPIFDSLRGCRGELNIVIKIEFFGDANEFKDASTGVQFFSSSNPGIFHTIEESQGLVEYLVVKSDPEYHWVDNFRASRISNEQRQFLFYNLSGKLRRQIGKRALEMGGNAVLNYHQYFDLEGENGLVARGYGTCCFISSVQSKNEEKDNVVGRKAISTSNSQLAKSNSLEMIIPSITPEIKDTILKTSLSNSSANSVKMFTLNGFEMKQIERIGGMVIARSVKLLRDSKSSNSKIAKKIRNEWWQELREEIRAHAKFFGCDSVIGYYELNTTDIEKEVCVLTAVGTAATLSSNYSNLRGSSEESLEKDEKIRKKAQQCSSYFCHIPRKQKKSPYNMKFSPCNVCKRRNVPEILLTTIEPPEGIQITGKGIFLEARFCKEKKKGQGEANAIGISESLPFIEYNLHRQLMYKLRVMGMNAAFRIRMQLAIGDSLIVAIATATAFFLPALPSPQPLQINRSLDVVDEKDKQLLDIQHRIVNLSKQNQQNFQNASTNEYYLEGKVGSVSSDAPSLEDKLEEDEGEADSLNEEDQNTAFVVEVDDSMDEDIMAVLLEPPFPSGLSFCNTEILPGGAPLKSNAQMITAIRRVGWSVNSRKLNQQFSSIFHNLYSSILFKVRALTPCCLCAFSVDVHLPSDDELEITLNAMVVLESNEENSFNPHKSSEIPLSSSPDSYDELQFSMESPSFPSTSKSIVRKMSSLNTIQLQELKEELQQEVKPSAKSVELTPMNFIPGAHIVKYFGRIHLHLIKESFTVKEQGGLGAFTHIFVNELHALARSHVAALGGNALLSFRIDECTIMENASKNQSYCLLSISGDAALVLTSVELQIHLENLQSVPT